MNREITWERAASPTGPWQPVPGNRVPKYVLRKAAKPTWDGSPIVAYSYCYRKVARPGEASAR
jgi:hypothetical protein